MGPLSVEQYITAPGPYEYQIDMADSTASYDFSFYTRLDGYPSQLEKAGELPLRITWTSPSGDLFTENVYLPLEGRSSLFSRQVYQPYRANIRPEEPGTWKLTVAIPYSEGREVLQGLGLVVTTKY